MTEKETSSQAEQPQSSKPDALGTGAANAGAETETSPQMRIVTQYLKDLSFENPGAPHTLTVRKQKPEISIQVSVNVNGLSQTDYEVELKLVANAIEQDPQDEKKKTTLFIVELLYAGILHLEGIPQEHIQALTMVEGPRMFFPFARQIILEATARGGFPPLSIDPIDFSSLYRQQLEQAAEQAKQTNTQ